MITQLSKTSIFKGFTNSEISQLLTTAHYQIHTYKADSVIAYAHDNCESLFILLEGNLRAEMNTYNNKNITISDICAPDTFAEAFLFANKNKLLINIFATTEVKILTICKNELLKLLNANPRILNNYLNTTANRFVIISEKLRFLMFKTVKGKLANFILDLEKVNKNKNSFRLGKTHEELAALFGVTRPALTRNLLQLKKDAIIDIQNKEITIKNRKKLIRFLD